MEITVIPGVYHPLKIIFQPVCSAWKVWS